MILLGMIKRTLFDTLERSISYAPVTAILGPRQCGKTTLAKMIQSVHPEAIYLDLELTSDQFKLREPELYLKMLEEKLVIIDEIQLQPQLFSLIRSLCDQNRKPGRFLILGSASPSLVKGTSESLAGRIHFTELTPLLLAELQNKSEALNTLWMRGGFPDSFLAVEDSISISWRLNFIRTFLERDIPQLGIQIPAVRLGRFWTMLSHIHGQVFNASQIASGLGVSSNTISHYLDVLTDTYVVRQLPPWYNNHKKRLIKSPKIYIRDSGLLHQLQNIHSFEGLLSHPLLGNSWEGFCIEQIISSLPEGWQPFFYRTATGNEIDLILQRPDGKPPIPIEFKFSLTPSLSKGFYIGMDDIGANDGYVIYPGDETFPISDRATALPLVTFLKIFVESL